MVAPWGVHGCSGGMRHFSGGHVLLLQGACMVAPWGDAWLLFTNV